VYATAICVTRPGADTLCCRDSARYREGAPRRETSLTCSAIFDAIRLGGPDGRLTCKKIVHAVTGLPEERASAADLTKIARGRRGIEPVDWLRDTAWAEDANTGYAASRQVTATLTKR